jgi:energy-coupling factor transport system permease protein
VRRGGRLAMAMDARAFASGLPRTNARGSVWRGWDTAFVLAAALVCAAAVVAGVLAGTWEPVFA